MKRKKTGEDMDFSDSDSYDKGGILEVETAEEPLLVLSAEASRLSQLSLLERSLVSVRSGRSTEYPPVDLNCQCQAANIHREFRV